MYEDVLLILKACRGMLQTHQGVDAFQYAVLAHEIDKQVEFLQSMTTPPLRLERPSKKTKVKS